MWPGNDMLMRNILRTVRSEFWANCCRLSVFCVLVSSVAQLFLFIEIYCYLRSPYRDLGVYDSVVQVRTQCNRNDMCAHG